MNYCVKISCLQYGNAFVKANSPEEAKKKAEELVAGQHVGWFGQEITDMVAEEARLDETDDMEKGTLKIMQEIIDKIIEMDVNSIDYRVALDELSDCTYLIENGYSPEAVRKICESTTSGELYKLLTEWRCKE